jgi:hypothetical protein
MPFVGTPIQTGAKVMSLQEAIALQNPLLVSSAAEPDALFAPYRLGDLDLSNRLVMSPMTRSRALEGNVPNPLAATYYAQRASAGLIVTEATQVSPQGVGYIRTPGIHSAEQVGGWRAITDAVHRAAKSLPSSGTSDACRIQIFTAARCPSPRLPCRWKAKRSPRRGGPNW